MVSNESWQERRRGKRRRAVVRNGLAAVGATAFAAAGLPRGFVHQVERLANQSTHAERYTLPKVNGRTFEALAVEHTEAAWRAGRQTIAAEVAEHRRVVFEYFIPDIDAPDIIAEANETANWLFYPLSSCVEAGELGKHDLHVLDPAHDMKFYRQHLKLGVPEFVVGVAGAAAATRATPLEDLTFTRRAFLGSGLGVAGLGLIGGTPKQVEWQNAFRLALVAEYLGQLPMSDEPTLVIYPPSHMEALAEYMADPQLAKNTIDHYSHVLRIDLRKEFEPRTYEYGSEAKPAIENGDLCKDFPGP